MKFVNRLSSRLIVTHLLVAVFTIIIMSALVLFATLPLQRNRTYSRVTDILLNSRIWSHAPIPRAGRPNRPLSPRNPQNQQGNQQGERDSRRGSRRPTDNVLEEFLDRHPLLNEIWEHLDDIHEQRSLPPPRPRLVSTDELEFLLQELADFNKVRILLIDQSTMKVDFDTKSDTESDTGDLYWEKSEREEKISAKRLGLPEVAEILLPSILRGETHYDQKRWFYVSARLEPWNREDSQIIAVMDIRFNTQGAITRTLNVFTGRPLLIVLPMLLWVAALLSIWLTRLIPRGLQPLLWATQEIGAGNLAYRIPDDTQMPQEFMTLANAFNDMAEQTEHNQQAQRDFIANVSHDLKTPLTSIQGFSQALADGTAVGPMRDRAATIIYEEANRLAQRVEALLNLARLENPNRKLELQILDLNEYLPQLLGNYEQRSQDDGIALQWQPDPEPCQIEGDVDYLHRVFGNLLDNAFIHTAAGGDITVSTQNISEDGQGTVEVSIADNGSGIPAQDLPHIFERFYQVDKARSPSERGTGLGLPIVKELVEAHNGTYGVESTEGIGSRFWVQLKTVDSG